MAIPLFSWPIRQVPTVNVAGRFPLDDQEFEFTYRHPTHALHLHEYEGRIRMRRGEYDLQPGDVTLSPATVGTQYHLPIAGHHWCVHFDAVRGHGALVRIPWHMRLAGQRRHVADRIAEIVRLHRKPSGSPANARAGVLLLDLLLWLAGTAMASPTSPRSESPVDQLIKVLDDRFAEPWTVPQLAEMTQFSQDHLARVFRQRMGVTIPRYLMQRRVAHARHLLEITDLPVKRIAERVGMPDPQHFNKQFRLVTGISPSAARTLPTSNRSPASSKK